MQIGLAELAVGGRASAPQRQEAADVALPDKAQSASMLSPDPAPGSIHKAMVADLPATSPAAGLAKLSGRDSQSSHQEDAMVRPEDLGGPALRGTPSQIGQRMDTREPEGAETFSEPYHSAQGHGSEVAGGGAEDSAVADSKQGSDGQPVTDTSEAEQPVVPELSGREAICERAPPRVVREQRNEGDRSTPPNRLIPESLKEGFLWSPNRKSRCSPLHCKHVHPYPSENLKVNKEKIRRDSGFLISQAKELGRSAFMNFSYWGHGIAWWWQASQRV